MKRNIWSNGMKKCQHPDCPFDLQEIENFYKVKTKWDGLDAYCKKCRNKAAMAYRLSHPGLGQKEDRRWYTFKYTAKRRGHSVEITKEDWQYLVSQPCYYCGRYSENRRFCGIDRADNQLGYTETNSFSCCELCNKMKLTLSRHEFISRCKRIAYFHRLVPRPRIELGRPA